MLSTLFPPVLSAVGIVQGVGSLVTPALKSMMSKAVDPEDQGKYIDLLQTMVCLSTHWVYIASPECFACYSYSHVHSTLTVTMM